LFNVIEGVMKKIIKYWTTEELLFLKTNYKSMLQKELAKVLGRSKKSVGHKLMRLGWVVGDEEHLRRSSEVLRDLNSTNIGSNNPNWKGGVTKEPGRYARRFKKKFPEKYRAHCLIHYHVKKGNIKRKPCVVCGDVNSFAHHEDYTKPLEVVWLCRKHHREKHGGKH
jgi:hypothetical protein